MQRTRISLGALVILIAAGESGAVDYNAQVRAGVGLSDNIKRTEVGEVDETMIVAGFSFGAVQNTNLLQLDIQSQFDYVYYADDTFEEEVVGGLRGTAAFSLVRERLQWIIQDDFGQQLFNPLRPATPDNREDINYFSTGPTVNILPPGRNFITVSALYSRVDYEIRDADNDRLSGTLSFGRNIGRNSALSLNFSTDRVTYDDGSFAPPVDRAQAFIQYQAAGARNTFEIDLGYNEFEYQGLEGDGILARANWSFATTANGTLTILAGSRFSDQGDLFRFRRSTAPDLGNAADVPSDNGSFLNNYLTLGYGLAKDVYTVSANAGWSQDDSKGSVAVDRDVYEGDLNLRRDFTRSLHAIVSVRFQKREFKFLDRRDDDLTLGLEIGKTVSAGFELSAEYQHFKRRGIGQGVDVAENRAFLRIAYTPVWAR